MEGPKKVAGSPRGEGMQKGSSLLAVSLQNLRSTPISRARFKEQMASGTVDPLLSTKS